MTNEEFYDREVAPKLLELCNACGARGMSFLASVEYGPEGIGETTQLAPDASVKAVMAYWGIKARGNIDAFMIAAQRHANEHGHSSAVLSILGSPVRRSERTDDDPR